MRRRGGPGSGSLGAVQVGMLRARSSESRRRLPALPRSPQLTRCQLRVAQPTRTARADTRRLEQAGATVAAGNEGRRLAHDGALEAYKFLEVAQSVVPRRTTAQSLGRFERARVQSEFMARGYKIKITTMSGLVCNGVASSRRSCGTVAMPAERSCRDCSAQPTSLYVVTGRRFAQRKGGALSRVRAVQRVGRLRRSAQAWSPLAVAGGVQIRSVRPQLPLWRRSPPVAAFGGDAQRDDAAAAVAGRPRAFPAGESRWPFRSGAAPRRWSFPWRRNQADPVPMHPNRYPGPC